MMTQSNIIQCRAAVGTRLPSKPWRSGEPCSFCHFPGGLHTITAGFRENDRITIAVDVDETAPGLLQESFEHLTATTEQEPFGDEDHAGKKATLRFPAGKVRFEWGEVHGVEGVIVNGAEPTSYGAEVVNGRTYRSWSPEFTTDADYSKAVCNNGHWTFPDFVRGSATNPAKITGVSFCIGALTNTPAFKAMPMVKAKQADGEPMTTESIFARLAEEQAELDEVFEQVSARQQ